MKTQDIHILKKDVIWTFDRKATDDEVHLFYELIEQYGFKFNLNTGVTM